MRKGEVSLDVVSKKSLILRILLTSLLIILIYLVNLGGCAGGGNEAIPPEVEEFTLFMDLTLIELSDGIQSPCPKHSAVLELQLKLRGERFSGQARLIGFSMLGSTTELSGVVEGESIVFDAFSVSVDDGRPMDAPLGQGPSRILFNFDSFIGTLIDGDQGGATHTLEVDASGRVNEIDGGDAIVCDGPFSTERLAEDCLPYLFRPYIDDCLAESLAHLCEPLFCFGPCTPTKIISKAEISFSTEAGRFALDNLKFGETTINFDEPEFSPAGPINGETVGGVAFFFTVDAEPSGDAVVGVGSGATPLMTPPMIEGTTAGLLTLVFDPPVDFVGFDFSLLEASMDIADAATMTLLHESGSLLSTGSADAFVPQNFLFPEGILGIEAPALCADFALGGGGDEFCEVLDCGSISCEGQPSFTNLHLDPIRGLVGNFGTPDNVGEEFDCH